MLPILAMDAKVGVGSEVRTWEGNKYGIPVDTMIRTQKCILLFWLLWKFMRVRHSDRINAVAMTLVEQLQ